MTLLTALTINNPTNDIQAAYAGPSADGKFGLWIQIWEGEPKHPRLLLSSTPIYATADEAKAAGQAIIDELRAPGAVDKMLGSITKEPT